MTRPPFRADHVGSLLRPAALKEARARRERGEISAAALRAVEDECIRQAVSMQEDIGLQAVTDGEFRRTFFHVDFLARLDGVATDRQAHRVEYRGERSRYEYDVPVPVVTGKLRRRSSQALDEFAFLAGATRRMPKVCIPAPSMLHFPCGDRAIDRDAYPDLGEFFADLQRVYREELQALHADLIEGAIRDRPADLAVCVHLCRGNFSRRGAASGGYEAIAEVFPRLSVDGFFLEFDDPRSGGFAPLRHVPKGGKVVLGLVSTKTPALERREDLEAKIEQAAKHMRIEDLCISPQCGFSSTQYGTELTAAEQAAKLRRVVELADRFLS